jgi:hypothetical protein
MNAIFYNQYFVYEQSAASFRRTSRMAAMLAVSGGPAANLAGLHAIVCGGRKFYPVIAGDFAL